VSEKERGIDILLLCTSRDAMAIKDYFQKQCEQTNEHYITGLYDLLTKLEASDEKNKGNGYNQASKTIATNTCLSL
jgi:UTP-glucose-1-phosphate uridylyltransferase